MQRGEDGCRCFDETVEVCPLHTQVERFNKLVTQPDPPMYDGPGWTEVTVAPGRDNIFHLDNVDATVFLETYLPAIFVVRGSQMFKLKWPDLPPKDPKKTSMR